MSGSQRLQNLLRLADQGSAMRAALAEEVADLLIDWPGDCPAEMRGTCEALLARAASEVDEDIRVRLRVRLYTDAALSARVLPRAPQDKSLIAAARQGEDLIPRIARALSITDQLAAGILRDESGYALAVACKALGLGRAAYSSLALLIQPLCDVTQCYARLDVFESISAADAARELRRWTGETALAAE